MSDTEYTEFREFKKATTLSISLIFSAGLIITKALRRSAPKVLDGKPYIKSAKRSLT